MKQVFIFLILSVLLFACNNEQEVKGFFGVEEGDEAVFGLGAICGMHDIFDCRLLPSFFGQQHAAYVVHAQLNAFFGFLWCLNFVDLDYHNKFLLTAKTRRTQRLLFLLSADLPSQRLWQGREGGKQKGLTPHFVSHFLVSE